MHNFGVINNYNSQHELNEPLLVLEFKNYKCAKYFLSIHYNYSLYCLNDESVLRKLRVINVHQTPIRHVS